MKSLQEIKALGGEQELRSYLSKNATRVNSAHLLMGKVIAALASLKPEKMTLKKFVRGTGKFEIPDHAFSCMNSFTLVQENILPEKAYDSCALRWLLQVSAILNLAKKLPDSNAGKIKLEVARILDEKPENGQELLLTLKKSLQGNSEQSATTSGTGEAPEVVQELATSEPVDLLSKEHIREIGEALGACNDPEKLAQMEQVFLALAQIAETRKDMLLKKAASVPVAA